MGRLDRLSPGPGIFLQPWALVAAGAATVVQAKLSSAGDYLTLVLFCVPATPSSWAWSFTPAFAPAAPGARLGQVRAWIATHEDQAIIVGLLVVGFWLAGHSIYLIVTQRRLPGTDAAWGTG